MSQLSWQLNDIDQALIDLALSEDLSPALYDATGEGCLDDSDIAYHMQVISKENAPIIACGEALTRAIYARVYPDAELDWQVEDGASLAPRDVLFSVKGSAKGLLIAERTVLNYLQRLCAVATLTHAFADLVKDTNMKLLDTRKTTPGMRHLEKYAVACGGGVNHRMGLYDAIMLKDNHIDLLGGMENALLRLENAKGLPVIVEVRSVEEFRVVLSSGQGKVTRVLLDNMSISQLAESVALNAGVFETEASGGLHLGNILDIANTGVDYASVGALTHSAGSLDLSMQVVV